MAVDKEQLIKQVQIVLKALEGQQYKLDQTKGNRVFEVAVDWLRNFPQAIESTLKDRLFLAIQTAFGVSESTLIAAIEGIETPILRGIHHPRKAKTDEDKFRGLLPRVGWFRWYDEYTINTESPLSYHIMSSFAVLGACLGRRVWIDMGFYSIYPNICCVLVGPTGLVKKTSAVDIAKALVECQAICPIVSEQITPSAFVSMLVKGGGWQFIYAPEMSNMFSKEKFNEGLVTRIIRLLDCPAEYTYTTQGRGDETVKEVALTILGGTTPDQISDSMPREVIQSGFINRFMWVVEEDTDRVVPRPSKGLYEHELIRDINRMKTIRGEVMFSKQSEDFYTEWYIRRKDVLRANTDVRSVRSMQRGDVWFLKMSAIINLVLYDEMVIRPESMRVASGILEYIEERLPRMVALIDQAPTNQDQEFIMEVLRKMGGATDHSSLLRRVSVRIGNASRFKEHIRTLEEGGYIKVSKRGLATFYILQETQIIIKEASA